jgi:hypothetical protein
MNESENPESSAGAKRLMFDDLAVRFPNLRHSVAASDKKLEAQVIRECYDLLSFSELLGFSRQVWEIGIHGSVPVMYVSVGTKDDDQGRIVKKIYNFKHNYKGNMHDTYEFEIWDPHNFPEFKNIADMLDSPDGFESGRAGNYYLTMVYPMKTE